MKPGVAKTKKPRKIEAFFIAFPNTSGSNYIV